MLPRGLFLSAVSLLLLCVGSAGEPIVRLRRRARVAAAYNRTPALGPIRRSQQPLGKRAPRDWREPQGGVEVPQDIDQRRRKESWYPQFPPCNGSPFPVLKYPGRDPRKWPCKQYPLPPEAARFLDVTAADVRPPVNATYPGYLFVLGTAYGGTTALLGLLSSSPKVTIPDAGWAHEGHWQLVRAASCASRLSDVAFAAILSPGTQMRPSVYASPLRSRGRHSCDSQKRKRTIYST